MNTTDARRKEKSRTDHREHPALFGRPPLFDGEDTKIYDQLLTEVFTAVKPADILEDIWVRDYVNLAFEGLRLRRLRAALMTANAYKGLSETLTPLMDGLQAQKLAKGWAARKPEVIEEVNKILTSAGLSNDSGPNFLPQTERHRAHRTHVGAYGGASQRYST